MGKLFDYIFRRQKFCCCLPVRVAVIVISLFTLLVSGFIALVSWFEVATYNDMWGPLRDAYIAAGVIYSLMLVASTLGFIGGIVRKQLFVTIFSYALYINLLINAGLAGYILWMVNHAEQVDLEKLCDSGLHNSGTSDQCSVFLKVTDGVVFGVAFTFLAIELYWAIVISRYVNQIKSEKTSVRDSRMMARQSRQSAGDFSLLPTKDETNIDQTFNAPTPAYNPYKPYDLEAGSTYDDPFTGSSHIPNREIDLGNENDGEHGGYGGGAWRYSSVMQNEKDNVERRQANATESTLVDPPLPLPGVALFSPYDAEDAERTPTSSNPSPRPTPAALQQSPTPFINRPLSSHYRPGTGSNSNLSLPAYSFAELKGSAGNSPSA